MLPAQGAHLQALRARRRHVHVAAHRLPQRACHRRRHRRRRLSPHRGGSQRDAVAARRRRRHLRLVHHPAGLGAAWAQIPQLLPRRTVYLVAVLACWCG
jgi:hypothetical protein